ncbi:MAG: SDR family NAD(P)-dependent oxidoreductase [Candidatus Dojkabacteria bacterium]|nr:MAG: SDR family NAD(P)-dependent oxidoreductase [Candidatus Dojkabacteria bacterium]
MKLQGKTIVVTGASSGIGKGVALRAAKDGATIIMVARNLDKLQEAASEVQAAGGTPIIVKADVTNVDDVRNIFLKATEDGRVLDAVFNNAGLGFVGPIYQLTPEQIRTMIDVNTYGMILVTKFASEVMVRQQYGHIVMTSSMAGLITLPQWSVYVGTKWAVTGFADSIRYELSPYNVKVTTLHPGAVRTGFFDKGKADLDITKLGGDAIDPSQVAEEVYNALFTNTQKIIVPKSQRNFAFLYRYLPSVVQNLIEKQSKDVEYHADIKEDEPGFSYIKQVRVPTEE